MRACPRWQSVWTLLMLFMLQVPSLLDSSDALPHGMSMSPRQSSLTLQLYVRYQGAADLRDVTISLSAPPGLQLDQVCLTSSTARL